jgi:excisionase family DNA binding protein
MSRVEDVGSVRRTASVAEFARIVGISRSLAYELVREGRIRAVHINRRIVIPHTAINQFLDQRSTDSHSEGSRKREA